MQQFDLNPNIKIYLGTDATVSPVNEYAPNAPKEAPKVQQSAENGDLLWIIKDVEVISTFGVTKSNLTIVSKTAPVVNQRTEYGFVGSLVATTKAEAKKGFNGGDPRAIESASYKLTGALKPAGSFPTKD